jgi:hypothetical protein
MKNKITSEIEKAISTLKADSQKDELTIEISLTKLDEVAACYLANTLGYLHEKGMLDYFTYLEGEIVIPEKEKAPEFVNMSKKEFYAVVKRTVKSLREIPEENGFELLMSMDTNQEISRRIYNLTYNTELKPKEIAKLLKEYASI